MILLAESICRGSATLSPLSFWHLPSQPWPNTHMWKSDHLGWGQPGYGPSWFPCALLSSFPPSCGFVAGEQHIQPLGSLLEEASEASVHAKLVTQAAGKRRGLCASPPESMKGWLGPKTMSDCEVKPGWHGTLPAPAPPTALARRLEGPSKGVARFHVPTKAETPCYLCWALRLEGRRLLVGSLEKTPCVRRGPGEKIPKPSAGRRGKGSTELRQMLGSELDFCGAGEPKLWLTVSWG